MNTSSQERHYLPTAADDHVFVGSNDGTLYAFYVVHALAWSNSQKALNLSNY